MARTANTLPSTSQPPLPPRLSPSHPSTSSLLSCSPNAGYYGIGDQCYDQATDAQTSCGWISDGSGTHIPYSQGFCCTCDAGDLFSGTLIPRSGHRCNLFEKGDTAHCMRLDNLWHAGYDVGSPSIDFSITVNVTQCRLTAAAKARLGNTSSSVRCTVDSRGVVSRPDDCECATLSSATDPGYLTATDASSGVVLPPLGPSMTTRCMRLPFSTDLRSCDVKIDLQGTFVSYQGTPDYSSKRLLVPTLCPTSLTLSDPCWAKLGRPVTQWLLVDKSLFTAGDECNKVGTSWQAFETQGSACEQPKDTCLAGQPSQLWSSDNTRSQSGLSTQYWLGGYKESTAPADATGAAQLSKGTLASDFNRYNRDNPGKALKWPTRRFQKSVITLTLRADPASLRFVVDVSIGVIVAVAASPFSSLSTGVMTVTVANTGAVSARFTLAVSCPADSFVPIPARVLSLRPANGPITPSTAASAPAGSVTTEAITLQTLTQTAVAALCSVTLLDAQGNVADYKVSNVTTTAVVHDPGSQGGGTGGNSNNQVGATNSSSGDGWDAACGKACPSWFDISCAVNTAKDCVGRLGSMSAGLVGSILGALMLFKYPFLLTRPLGMVFGVLRRLLGCGGSKSNQKQKQQKQKQRRRRDDDDSSAEGNTDAEDADDEDKNEQGKRRRQRKKNNRQQRQRNEKATVEEDEDDGRDTTSHRSKKAADRGKREGRTRRDVDLPATPTMAANASTGLSPRVVRVRAAGVDGSDDADDGDGEGGAGGGGRRAERARHKGGRSKRGVASASIEAAGSSSTSTSRGHARGRPNPLEASRSAVDPNDVDVEPAHDRRRKRPAQHRSNRRALPAADDEDPAT